MSFSPQERGRKGETKLTLQYMHLNWALLFILCSLKLSKCVSEQGGMEQAVENGSVTILHYRKGGQKIRVLPTKRVLPVLYRFQYRPTSRDGVPKGNGSNQKAQKFHLFSAEAIDILSLSCQLYMLRVSLSFSFPYVWVNCDILSALLRLL